MSEYKFETLQLHVGQENPDPATDSRAVPIYATTSYVFHDCAHAAARFGLQDAGNIYGRLTNSTQDVFEKRIAALEGGVAALAVASGAAAISYTIQALAQNGGHIVAQKTIYGGSYNLLANTLPNFGITASFVNIHDIAEVESAIKDNTRAIYIETLGNPNSDIPAISAPNPSYHGVSFTQAVGAAAFVTCIRAILLRDTGASISPFAAFLLLQGTETLSLRLERHAENTKKVVAFLANHPQVEKVNHPSLADHPDHALYEKYFPNGGGSIFTFEIKGGEKEAHKFIDSLKIFSLLANVADVKSLIIHPATTTHSQLTEEELKEQNIKPNTIRLSIGTEHIDDILADLQRGFEAVL